MACGFIHHIVISCHCVHYGVTSHCNPLCVTGISDYAEIVEDEGDYSTPSGECTRQAPPSSKSLPLYMYLLKVSTALYTSLLQVSTALHVSTTSLYRSLPVSTTNLYLSTRLYYKSLPLSTRLYYKSLPLSTCLYYKSLPLYPISTPLYYHSLPSFPIDLYTLIHLLLYDISSLENFISFLNTSISISDFFLLSSHPFSVSFPHSFYLTLSILRYLKLVRVTTFHV